MFLEIERDLAKYDPYFEQRFDATGKAGATTKKKMTASLRMLCYGLPADAVDDYCRIYETTATTCLKRFCRAIVGMY